MEVLGLLLCLLAAPCGFTLTPTLHLVPREGRMWSLLSKSRAQGLIWSSRDQAVETLVKVNCSSSCTFDQGLSCHGLTSEMHVDIPRRKGTEGRPRWMCT
ncbi:hypothetical protein TREES_T100016454 [Tupaia chinensis]|uniref:Uncharacterized protein n=1 Tax=Tupaia chinensis TaxID=246437 RepID=L8YAS1_TUPCH|nr:hypothetical protein TREES_T100016454 [Tupaia chinensis]